MAMDLCPAKTRDSARMRGCGGGGGTREAGSVGTGLAGARLLQTGKTIRPDFACDVTIEPVAVRDGGIARAVDLFQGLCGTHLRLEKMGRPAFAKATLEVPDCIGLIPARRMVAMFDRA